MKKCLLMCLMALGIYQAQAVNRYVNDGFVETGSMCSVAGSPSNDGLSTSTPKTLDNVFSSVQPGDVVYIDKGTYVNLFKCADGLPAGTAANHIKFIGVDSSNTIISGTTTGTDAFQMACSAPANLYWEFSNLKITAEAGLTAMFIGIGGKNFAYVDFTNCLITSQAGPAINITNGCGMNYFTFTGCKIQSGLISNSTINMTSASNATYNTFTNCRISNLANNGNAVVSIGAGNRVNNKFDGCYFSNAGAGYILNFDNGDYSNTIITNCQFRGTNSSEAIHIIGANANVTGFQITNNFFSNVATGIASSVPSQGALSIINNSFATTGNCIGNTSTGGNFAGATVTNNILYSTGGAGVYGVYISGTNAPATSDYNQFSATNVGFYGSARTTLAAWQTATSKDANSASGNPNYAAAATGDLSIACSSPAYRTGTATALTTDIFGSTRPATPSKGAYENTTVVTVTTNPTAPSYCPGGSASITASGATTYSWSPATALSATTGATVTANPTTTTTYTITGTSAGCSGTATVTVTVNDLPTITVSPAAPAICEGGSVDLTASGATSYSWTPATDLDATTGATVNASPASDATYTVSGTDGNGCTNTTTVLVTVNANPAAPTLSDFDDVCSNASAVILSGASPAGGVYSGTGVTSGEFDPSTGAGTYTITYTYTDGNGCSSEIDASITVNAAPAAPVLANFADVCSNASAVMLSGATPAGGVYSGTGVTAGSFDPATAGSGTHTITYTITDANSCIASTDATITVNVCTGINGSQNGVATSVYPNPNDGSFQLTFDPNKSGNVEMILLNAQGQEQYRRKIAISGATEKVALDVTPGVYHLQLLYEGSTYHEKVVIR